MAIIETQFDLIKANCELIDANARLKGENDRLCKALAKANMEIMRLKEREF